MFSFGDGRLCITEAYSKHNFYIHKHDIQFTIQLGNDYSFKLIVIKSVFMQYWGEYCHK